MVLVLVYIQTATIIILYCFKIHFKVKFHAECENFDRLGDTNETCCCDDHLPYACAWCGCIYALRVPGSIGLVPENVGVA